ncbi:DNA ligase [Candidatus Methanoperedenaceae archaeon GB37]|nr:DNA ligase [Candidatus Methanoperedenaceae archaeon GB37]
MGGKSGDTVSKKINYVVVGKNPGSKLEKAKRLGLKIITEQEFLEMIKER